MEQIINFPEYNKSGLKIKWEKNFKIKITNNKQIILKSNKEGLISLARIFLSLSQDNVPEGYHIHLDESNSLQDGSSELIIERQD